MQGHVDGTGRVGGDPRGGLLAGARDRRRAAARALSRGEGLGGDRRREPDGERARDEGFAVSLIPETLKRTNLGAIGEGARVNIEVDILAKHVERLMGAAESMSDA